MLKILVTLESDVVFFLNFGMNFDIHSHCNFHGNYFFALLSLVNAKGRQKTSECSISTVTLFSLYCFPGVKSIVPNSTTLLPNCGVNFTRKSLPVWHTSVYAKRPTTLLLSASRHSYNGSNGILVFNALFNGPHWMATLHELHVSFVERWNNEIKISKGLNSWKVSQ